MKIKKATINDAQKIFKLKKTTWLDTYPNEKYNIKTEDILKRFADEKHAIEKIKKSITKRNCWIAEIDGEIVGLSMPSQENGKDYIGATYVLPNHQGKGIGGKLLQKVLDYFHDSKEIWLEVVSYNQNTIKFYEKFAFKIVPGSENQHEIIKNKYLPTISMLKQS